jgi:hypothetical protein
MMYVELCRIGVGYLVDFLHLDHFAHEAIVNLNNPQAAVAAAQVLSGISLGGSAPLMVGIARVQGCGANIVHYATRGILAEEAKKAQKESQKLLKPVASRAGGVKSFEYTCPAFDMTAHPPPTAASASTEVSDEDEKIAEPVAKRGDELAPRFASLGITLDQDGASESYAATESSAPAQVGALSYTVAPTRTPPRTSVQPSKDEKPVPQRRAVNADMERALHAGFPSLLSSPACNLMPSSRGSSVDSRLPRSATPPLSGPQSQTRTRLPHRSPFPRLLAPVSRRGLSPLLPRIFHLTTSTHSVVLSSRNKFSV